MKKNLHLLLTLVCCFALADDLWAQCTNPSISLPDQSNPVDGNPATAYCVTLEFNPAMTGYPTGVSMLLQHTYQGDLDLFINACGNTLNIMQRPGAIGNCAGGSPFGNSADIGSPGNPVQVTFSDGGGPNPENGIAVGGGNYGITTDDACGVGTPGINSFAALWGSCPPGTISAQICIGDHAFGDSGVAQNISLNFPSPIICGCTDPAAANYNPAANVDDGSCMGCSLTVSASATQPSCNMNNGGISVTPSGAGYTYTWSPASVSGSNPTNLAPGTYNVTVTQTATGCTGHTTITLSPSAALSASVTPIQPTCGMNNGSISVSPSGAGYTYAWSPASLSGSNPTNLAPGSYSVTITQTSTGCTAVASATLNPSTSITATATPTQPTCSQSNGSISVTPSGAGYTYAWSPASVSGANPTNLPAGTYTVTVTQTSTGCNATASVTLNPSITITPTATPTQPTCGLNNGSISVSPSGAGYTYAWSPASLSGANPTNLAPGTYTVTVTETASGCMAPVSVTLNPSTTITAAATPTQPTCALNNGSISVSPSGGGYTYAWSPASVSGPNPTNLAPGSYTVTVTEISTGCVDDVSVTLNPSTPVMISLNVNQPTCGQNNGVINVTPFGPGYSYTWNPASLSGSAAVNLAPGTYSVTITQLDGGCTDEASVTLNPSAPPMANATASPAAICPGGSTTLTATGGGTYTWSTGQTGSSITVSPGSTTTYSVTVNNSGCAAVGNVTVTVNTVTATATASPMAACSGDPVQLTATGGGTYAWSTGQSGATITVNPTATTTYSVTVTNNGCTDVANVTVNVNTVTANATANPTVACSGDPVQLTATGGGTYSWSTGQTGANVTVNPTTTTTYSVTVTNNGCSEVADVTVTVNAVIANATANPQTVCAGDPVQLTATGGVTYLWSTGQTGAVITVNPSATTTYSVTATNAGCTDVAGVIVVVTTVNATASANPNPVCEGQSAVLTATGGGTYSWSTGQSGASITVSPATTTPYTVTVTNSGCTATSIVTVVVNAVNAVITSDVNPVCAGSAATLTATGGGTYSWSTGQSGASISVSPTTTTTYTVTVTNNGCTDIASMTINVNSVTASASAAPATVCEGGATTLTATGGGTYSWSTGQSGASITVNPTATTTYTVTVTNNGCTDIASVTVTVNTVTAQATASPAGICEGATTTLTATGGGTYSWSTGQIGASITVAPTSTTTYTVTVTNNGCTDEATVTVTVNTVNAGATATPSTVCAGQSVALSATGGGTYLWNTGQTAANINVAVGVTATFTVTVTNNGCSDVASVTVNVNSVLATATASPSSICPGLSSQLTATGGGTYNWSTGQTGATITVTPAATTTYSVTVTNGGCTNVAQVTVDVSGVLTPSITASPPTVCPGQPTTLTAAGGDSYSWSTGQSGATITVSPSSTTTYTVTATNNGCDGTATITVTVDPSLTATATASPATVCAGAATTLTATGGGNYSWSSGQTGAAVTVNPSATTTYTVTVTNNGCTGTADVTVNVTPPPTATASASPATICAGATTTLTATGGGTYEWMNSQIGSSITVAPAATTTYTVTVTNNGCTATADVTVTVNPLPTPTASASAGAVCAGQSVDLTATGGGTYSWSSGQTGSPVTVTPAATTTYTVTVTTNGCTATANTTVTVTPPPTATATASSATICAGASSTLTATGGTGYEWSSGQSGASVMVSPAATTTYTVTVTNNGCTATAEVTVTVNPVPQPTVTASPDAVCEGSSTTLTATGGGTYSWSSGASGSPITVTPAATTTYGVTVTTNGCTGTAEVTVTVNNAVATASAVPATICPGLTSVLTATGGGTYAWSDGQSGASISVTPAATTTYTVTVTNNGCTDVAEVTVNVENNLSATATASPASLCSGESTVLSSTGGGTYAWSNGQSGASITVTPLSTTTYTVTVTNNGCTGTADVTVTVTATPSPTASASPGSICLGQSSVLTATGGGTYSWSSGQTGASITVFPSETTTYEVTANNNGCTATAEVTVTVNNAVATASAIPAAICPGLTSVLTATGGGTYAWSNGQNGASISVTPAATTTYSVTVTNNGCTDVAEVTVTVQNNLSATATAFPATICSGESTTLSSTGGGTYAWSNGQSGASISVTPLSATTYTVTVTNNGCTGTASVTVTVVPTPSPTAGASPGSICLGQSSVLTATGGGTYSWSNGQTGASITVTPSATTTYTVTVNNNGCTATAQTTVVVTPSPAPVITANSPALCQGESTTLTATGGGTYTWSTGQTGPSITVTPSLTTTYDVTATNNGCVGSAQTTITVSDVTASASAVPAAICPGLSSVLTATGGGTYTWSTGQSGASITVTPAVTTTYTVTVTDNGCEDVAQVTVTVQNNLAPVATASPATLCAGESTTLTAMGGATYTWSNGQSGASITVTPSATTTYGVTATNNGCSGTTEVTVVVNSIPIPAATANPATICAGQSTALMATGGVTYDWSSGQTGASIAVSPLQTTTYTVTVTNNGCSATATTVVTVNSLPVPTAMASPDVLCVGQSTVLTATGGTSYVWSSGQNGASITVAPSQTTTYTVTVTDNGCTATANTTVTVNPLPVPEATASPGVLCAGETTTLTATGGTTYLWSTGESGASIEVTPTDTTVYSVVATTSGCSATAETTVIVNTTTATATADLLSLCPGLSTNLTATGGGTYQWSTGQTSAVINVTPAATTTYSVAVTNNGCTDTASVTVMLGNVLIPHVEASPATVCPGQTSVLTATGGSTYSWDTGASTASIEVTPSVTTTYSVTVTNGLCTGSATITVTVDAGLLTTAVASPDTICAGQSATLTATGGGTYAWSDGQPGATIIVSPAATTTYGVTVSNNGCQGSSSVEVIVLPLPEPVITATPDTICVGESTVLTASGGTTYVWSNGELGSSITVLPVTSTTYSVTATDQGCTGTASISIVVQPLPVPAIVAAPDAVCPGTPSTLTASGGDTYTWSHGPSGATVVVTPAATSTYSVTATDNGCQGTASVTVSVNPLPLPGATATPAVLCVGASSVLTATGGDTYSWSTGQSGPSITVTPATTTTYQVTVTDVAGCQATTSVTVTVNPLPIATATASPAIICAGDNTTLTATGGGTYLWNTGEMSSSIVVAPLNTTTYSVTVTNLGCTAIAQVTVLVNPLPVATADPDTICVGESATLSATGGDIYQWSTGQTGSSIVVTPLVTTTYTVTATEEGCEATVPVTVTVNPLPVPVAVAVPPVICRGQTGELQVSGGATYVWNTGQTGAVIQVSPISTTTYSVTATANGCTGSTQITMLVSQPPFAVVTPTATVCNGPGGPATLDFSDLVTAGDQNGVWTDVQNTGASGTFPSLDFTGVTPGVYLFRYTTQNTLAPCENVSYDVNVEVVFCNCPSVVTLAADPLCNENGTLDLSTLEQTTEAGVWSIISSPAGTHPATIANGIFNAIDADAGTYQLRFTLLESPPAGCPAFSTQAVQVAPRLFAGTPEQAAHICFGENHTFSLGDLLQGEDAGGQWTETSAAPSTGGAFQANAATFNTSGQQAAVYRFRYLVNSGGICPSHEAAVTIEIEPLPVAQAGSDRELDCVLTETELNGTGSSSGANISYQWTSANGGHIVSGANILTPLVDAAGTYLLTVTDQAYGCKASDEAIVIANNTPPEAAVVSAKDPLCHNQSNGSISVVSVTGGSEPYLYSINHRPFVASPDFTGLAAGNYPLEIEDANGCRWATEIELENPAAISVDAGPDVTILYGDSTLLTATVTPAQGDYSFSWTPSDSLACPDCGQAVTSPLDNTLYEVLVTDVNGCQDRDQVRVTVRIRHEVYIPNGFSPNNDNVNDIFMIYAGEGVEKVLEFDIYSRWGESVFYAANFPPNSALYGWNGIFRNQPAALDVYTYYARILFKDGKEKLFKGDVLLAR